MLCGWLGEATGGHQPRDVGGLRNLEKVRKHILYWSLQKECSLQTVKL